MIKAIRILEEEQKKILETIEEVSQREEYPFKKNCLLLLDKSAKEID